MSENNLSEIVGEDVNIASEAQETIEAPQDPTPQEPTAQADEPQEPQQPDSRTVPLAALHEERQRRKELAAEVQRIREEQARRDALIEQRLAAITEARQQAQTPSFDENPAEHLRYGQQQLQQTVQQIAEANRQAEQQRQQAAVVQQLAGLVQQHEAVFVQSAPDYNDAVTYLRNQRAAELMADGADEVQAAQIAHRELVNLALQRAHQGQNPAEAAYKIAKARGYSPKPTTPTAAEKLQTQQRGVAASKTLGSGGPASNKITAEALASMSDDEFAELTKGNNWQKIMG